MPDEYGEKTVAYRLIDYPCRDIVRDFVEPLFFWGYK